MMKDPLDTVLQKQLDYLKLPYCQENFRSLAAEANTQHWTHLDYLARLVEGEAAAQQDRAVLRRVKAARFPVIKTLDTFRWDWPKKINRLQIQDLFRLSFIDKKANVIFLGLCGLGKSHLATALGYAACQQSYSVLFANAIDVINTLSAAQSQGALKGQTAPLSRPLNCSFWTRSVISLSISAEPTCCSKLSAGATSVTPSSLLPTKPSNSGPLSSTVIAPSLALSSIGSCTTQKPS